MGDKVLVKSTSSKSWVAGTIRDALHKTENVDIAGKIKEYPRGSLLIKYKSKAAPQGSVYWFQPHELEDQIQLSLATKRLKKSHPSLENKTFRNAKNVFVLFLYLAQLDNVFLLYDAQNFHLA